jgi:hypothetical protein
VATEPVPTEESQPVATDEPIRPSSKKDFDNLLQKIQISTPKECAGKFLYLLDYFKIWDDEKAVNEYTIKMENDPTLKIQHKNPANHLRWIFHIICTITEYYKFFDSKRLIEKREHYHRLRSASSLKKTESKSVE